MRFIFIILFSLFTHGVRSQNSLNMNLLYQWDDPSLVSSFAHDNTYNEVWGYAKNGREYAIIGSTAGTHIFDISDINNVDTVDFIPGRLQGGAVVHRDYDTYKDYLYIVCDEGASSLQIADLTFLPDSASLVYDSNALIKKSHNIFIDTASGNLYTCGGLTDLGNNQLSIYSLAADPTSPQLLLNCQLDVPFWNTVGYVHDIYVRNDTAYCNSEGRGMFVVDFSDTSNVQLLGSVTSYPDKGYNHSGWLHSSGTFYAFADENHGLRIKIVDVTDLSSIIFIDTIGSNVHPLSMPHNLIFNGDNLYASYYFDGLYVFDASVPNNMSIIGYYDTSNRTHNGSKYEGNWGVYPFLPSGNILASDMQEGLFVFNTPIPSGFGENNTDQEMAFLIYPNPSSESIHLVSSKLHGKTEYLISDNMGRVVKKGLLTQTQSTIGLLAMASGSYTISLVHEKGSVSKKFIKK
jgi:choice-of-anchor B domain-containing protein